MPALQLPAGWNVYTATEGEKTGQPYYVDPQGNSYWEIPQQVGGATMTHDHAAAAAAVPAQHQQ